MEKTLQELKDEALALGLDIKGMKSKKEVSTIIEDYYESQSAGDLVQAQEDVEEITEEVSGKFDMNQIAATLKKEAMKKRVVTIVNNDKRDNSATETAYLSCENQYFGLSKIVPLGVPVELEQCLIDVAKSVDIMLHMDEMDDRGRRTGNKTFKSIKKYSVSFEDMMA